jgi:hypothetical protein
MEQAISRYVVGHEFIISLKPENRFAWADYSASFVSHAQTAARFGI